MTDPKYTYKCIAALQTELAVEAGLVASDDNIEHMRSLATTLNDEELQTTVLRLERMKELTKQEDLVLLCHNTSRSHAFLWFCWYIPN